MISAGVKALRERWRSPEGRALGLEVSRWLAGKGRRPPRSVGEFEGRVDLRGFSFPDARQVGTFSAGRTTFQAIEGFPQFGSVRWRGIDFTGAVIRSARFFTSTIEDCRFDHADLLDWRLWDSRITDCSFAAAELENGAIGTGNHRSGGSNGVNVWTRVNFDRANLKNATISECVLQDCTFRNTQLRKARFTYVTLDGVTFEGLLDHVLFEARQFEDTRDPGPMRNVDFRGVMFRECDFRGYQFEGVTFDESPAFRVVRDYPTVISRALDLARESPDREEQEMVSTLENTVGRELRRSYDSIFFLADFVSGGMAEAGAAFGRLLERAEADLASKGS